MKFSLKYTSEITEDFLRFLEEWCIKNTSGCHRDFATTTLKHFQEEKYYNFDGCASTGIFGYGIDNNEQDCPVKTYQEVCQIINYKDAKKMSDRELLEEAERRYPVGCKFIIAHASNFSDGKTLTVTRLPGEKFKWSGSNFILLSNSNTAKNGHSYNEACYYDGKWAEIISMPDSVSSSESILEQAKRKFPPGTVFYPAHLSGSNAYERDYLTVTPQDVFTNENDGSIHLQS